MSADVEEYKALSSTLLAFYHYGRWAYQDIIAPRKVKLASLTKTDLALIPWYPQHIEHIHECVKMNSEFGQNLALTVAPEWGATVDPAQWLDPRSQDFDKVRSVLLQLTREWSSDGEVEREAVFGKIIEALEAQYTDLADRQNIKVVVPGCGTGRLVFELVRRGFWCQGNEVSYHMLLASNFVLNHSFVAHHHSVFPYVHKFLHLTKRHNQIRPVTIPDVNPSEIMDLQQATPEIPYTELMSMTAGSFTDLYGRPNLDLESENYTNSSEVNQFRLSNAASFDVVVTCFFLDTALNIIDHLRAIHHCLKNGGLWVNFGPLLWHFEDDGDMGYITRDGVKIATAYKGLELSRDDLLALVKEIGFDVLKHESGIKTGYCADPRLLGGFEYQNEFWVATKLSTV